MTKECVRPSVVEVEISWPRFEDLEAEVKDIEVLESFSARFAKLKSHFTQVDGHHEMWLTMPDKEVGGSDASDKDIYLTLDKVTEYESNALSEAYVKSKLNPSNDGFYVIRGYEGSIQHGKEDERFKFRVDMDGKVGEIVWIQRGGHFSGSDLMCLFELLQRTLKIEQVFLKDDAEFEKIPLRVIKPITSEDGLTWYQKFGFKILTSRNVQDEQDSYYNQRPANVKKAIQKVRNFKIRDVLGKIKTSAKPTLASIMSRLFGSADPKAHTVGEMVSDLVAKSEDLPQLPKGISLEDLPRQVSQAHTAKRDAALDARKDLLWVYSNCLAYDANKESSFPPAYQNAVNLLHDTMLYVKRMPDEPKQGKTAAKHRKIK